MYLTYVSDNPSPQLMVFGLVFSIYFPMRATNSLMAAVRTAYHLGPPKGFITQWIKVLLYTVTLIVTIALTLSLMTFGERALWYTVEHFHLPEFLAKLWVTLRFPVAGAVSFLALFLLYALAQDTIQPLKNICPGTFCSPWRRGWRSAGSIPTMPTTSPTTLCSMAPSAPSLWC